MACKPPKNALLRHLRRENGTFAIIAVGGIALVLMFTALAINAANYYALRGQLQSVAQGAASYGANFLPNYHLAAQRASDYIEALRYDFRTDEQRFVNGITTRFYVDYHHIDPTSGASTVVRRDITGAIGLDYWPVGIDVRFPVISLTVEVNTTYNVTLMNLSPDDPMGFGTLGAVAEATAQLVPTDVVLVVDNSNSVISDFDEYCDAYWSYDGANIATQVAGKTHPFAMWDEWIGKKGNYWEGAAPGSPPLPYYSKIIGVPVGGECDLTGKMPLQKGGIRMRQCFGQVTRDIKQTALYLYDMFSSSATYRVGVVHTLNTGGEFQLPTFNITADSYVRPYYRDKNLGTPPKVTPTPGAGIERPYYLPTGNSALGVTDYPDSSCAALTDHTLAAGAMYWNAYPVPTHPLFDILNSAGGNWRDQVFFTGPYTSTNLRPLLKHLGKSEDAPASDPVAHLNWDPVALANTGLLPREQLWIKSAGHTFNSGLPDPKYDYANTSFAIRRAFDMLRAAPQRADMTPVRRKVVLVLTDGFETGVQYTGEFLQTKGMKYNYVASAADKTTPPSFPVLSTSYDDTNSQFYCTTIPGNPITALTDVDQVNTLANDQGIKLGILYYGFRGMEVFEGSDPLRGLKNLNGHQFQATDLDQFRDGCNTRWSTMRGRFFVEGSPEVMPKYYTDINYSSEFTGELSSNVTRAIFISELLDSKRNL